MKIKEIVEAIDQAEAVYMWVDCHPIVESYVHVEKPVALDFLKDARSQEDYIPCRWEMDSIWIGAAS